MNILKKYWLMIINMKENQIIFFDLHIWIFIRIQTSYVSGTGVNYIIII